MIRSTYYSAAYGLNRGWQLHPTGEQGGLRSQGHRLRPCRYVDHPVQWVDVGSDSALRDYQPDDNFVIAEAETDHFEYFEFSIVESELVTNSLVG